MNRWTEKGKAIDRQIESQTRDTAAPCPVPATTTTATLEARLTYGGLLRVTVHESVMTTLTVEILYVSTKMLSGDFVQKHLQW